MPAAAPNRSDVPRLDANQHKFALEILRYLADTPPDEFTHQNTLLSDVRNIVADRGIGMNDLEFLHKAGLVEMQKIESSQDGRTYNAPQQWRITPRGRACLTKSTPKTATPQAATSEIAAEPSAAETQTAPVSGEAARAKSRAR